MKRFWIIFVGLVALLALLLVGLGFFFGVFSPVRITKQVRGPYLMVSMLHRGAYHRVSEKIEKVGTMLDEMKIPKIIPCALFYDDPGDVSLGNLRSEGGYLVDQQFSLEHPFRQREIPKRSVIVATIKAHPLVAPFRTYSKIVEFMKMHHLKSMSPAFERYLPGGIVEVEMPFQSPELDLLHQTIKSMAIPRQSGKKKRGENDGSGR